MTYAVLVASTPQASINAVCPVEACGRILRTRQGLRRHLRAVHDIVEEERECSRCGKVKPAGCFGVVRVRTRRDGSLANVYRSACDDCRSEESERRVAARAARPESHRRRDRKKQIAATFGLTVEEYDAAWAMFFAAQNGLCGVCELVPPECLDHDHATGRLRGLLCSPCNWAAGHVHDDADVADRLAGYLRAGGVVLSGS